MPQARRRTDYIVIHCSATPPGSDIGADEIGDWHTSPPRNWNAIGYHAVIRRDGTLEFGRPFDHVGAHVRGHNYRSVGVCLVGGLDAQREPAPEYNDVQFATLANIVSTLEDAYPGARVLGHRDLSPDADGDGIVEREEFLKACPSFDVDRWLTTGEIVLYAEGSPA